MLDDPAVLDRAFHALADPSRRSMVDRLSRGPASVSELARPLEMSLAAALQQVQVLEASGLVESRKTGRVRTCRLNEEAMQSAEQCLAERRGVWEHRLQRLGEVLDEQAATTDEDRSARRTTRKRASTS
ncbi:ArsR/SmtB family transcription factor [Motilibacter deserti]|uniref:Winged helix-turn-helix transcriptional regulator n=1 Tax=Motilibacter deserti TaxID=2714956 RepID=A0ABX0GXN6_9ACTN|nr:winged helix-turn-helix transcriptional regulator [Motilibacter deserti]